MTYPVVCDDEQGGAHNLRIIFRYYFPFSMADFHSLLLQVSFSHGVFIMLNALKSRFRTSRKRSLDAQSVGEHWVVRYISLALAGRCPPSGTHDQPIVNVDVL